MGETQNENRGFLEPGHAAAEIHDGYYGRHTTNTVCLNTHHKPQEMRLNVMNLLDSYLS